MQGQAAVASDMKFSDLADQWITTYKSGLQPYTIVTYKTVIENHIKPAIGKYQLNKLEPIHIQKMISDAVTSGLSSSVVKKMKVFTNAILEVAIDNKLIYANPCRKIKLPPMPKNKKVKEAFLPIEEQRIINFASEYAKLRTKSKPYSTGWCIIILLKSGLRTEELLGLRWSDIDTELRTISVNQVVSLKDGMPYIKPIPKSESSERTIPMHDLAKQAFELVTKINNAENLIFPNADGGIWAERNFQRAYTNYFTALNKSLDENEKVKYRSPHCCRHTFATNLNRAGVDIKTMSELLGHSTVEMSLNVYTHTDQAAMTDAISRL